MTLPATSLLWELARWDVRTATLTTRRRGRRARDGRTPHAPDQRRSQSRPVSGTSVGRITRLICSIWLSSGERPPWQQKIFSSMMAAHGRQLNVSVNVFQSLML